MQANAYQQYKQQAIVTMTPMETVLKLFSETEREVSRAIFFINNKEYASANDALIKGQRLIDTLRQSLDMKYEVSSNLDALYDFFLRQLLQANLKKDVEPLTEILPMLRELRETFNRAYRTPK